MVLVLEQKFKCRISSNLTATLTKWLPWTCKLPIKIFFTLSSEETHFQYCSYSVFPLNALLKQSEQWELHLNYKMWTLKTYHLLLKFNFLAISPDNMRKGIYWSLFRAVTYFKRDTLSKYTCWLICLSISKNSPLYMLAAVDV